MCYSGQNCTRIPDALTKLYGHKVQSLDLSFNELITLKGLDTFTDLRELVLDNNKLGDNIDIPRLPKLHTLSLNKNQVFWKLYRLNHTHRFCLQICNLELLLKQIKNNLPALTYLSLLGNHACPNQLSNSENDEEDYQRYRSVDLINTLQWIDLNLDRYYVLYHLPNLKFLDSNSVKVEELNQAKSRGKFMNVVSPNKFDGVVDIPGHFKYTPLPKSLRSPEDYKGCTLLLRLG